MMNELSRRKFLSHGGTGVAGAWVASYWPQMLAAATHARQVSQSGAVHKFEFFTPEEAIEIDAFSARIIPTDETPGAREAGVLYFIDRLDRRRDVIRTRISLYQSWMELCIHMIQRNDLRTRRESIEIRTPSLANVHHSRSEIDMR